MRGAVRDALCVPGGEVRSSDSEGELKSKRGWRRILERLRRAFQAEYRKAEEMADGEAGSTNQCGGYAANA
jgi:hypothetical protein